MLSNFGALCSSYALSSLRACFHSNYRGQITTAGSRGDSSVSTTVAQMERGNKCHESAKVMPNSSSLLPSASCWSLLFTALTAIALAAGDVLYVDSPALPSQGHCKLFLSIRHHLCSHRFFQTESRARSRMQNIFPYLWEGVEMELGILAATTSIGTSSDAAYVTRFEALIFASIRNFSNSDTACYSHCISEVCQFTDLMCVVNGQAGDVHSPTRLWFLTVTRLNLGVTVPVIAWCVRFQIHIWCTLPCSRAIDVQVFKPTIMLANNLV